MAKRVAASKSPSCSLSTWSRISLIRASAERTVIVVPSFSMTFA